jgi:hypothetical protein
LNFSFSASYFLSGDGFSGGWFFITFCYVCVGFLLLLLFFFMLPLRRAPLLQCGVDLVILGTWWVVVG